MAFIPWIKIEQTLPDKPEIVSMAGMLRLDQDTVTGKLLRVWIWADANLTDGQCVPITAAFIDRLTNCRKFAHAMRSVGWLTGDDGALTFPGFDRHNGETAKERATIARRVDKHRRRNDVTVTDTPLFSSPAPLPRARAREEGTPLPPSGGASGSASGGFAAGPPAAPAAPVASAPVAAPIPAAARPAPAAAPSPGDDQFLIDHIKSLRRRWQASPLLSAREARIFRKNRAIVTLFTPDDWHTLAQFMTTRLPEGSSFFQPQMLEKFLENPGAILGHARDWKSKQRPKIPMAPPPVPAPDAPPATPEEMRQILGMKF